MGGEPLAATALTGRLAFPRRGAATAREEAELLAFHRTGGPLVVLRGLAGGAGTSTLSYLLARRAARHSSVPVLLTELRTGAGLAAIGGAASPLPLGELARAADEHRAPPRPFAELAPRLRLVATAGPSENDPADARTLEQLLDDARAAHGLVVVDAGQPAPGQADRLLARADRALFCLPATPAGLRRAELQLAGGLLRHAEHGQRGVLVCTATQPRVRPQLRQLRRLAEGRVDRLLLVPHIPRLAAGDHDDDSRLEDTFAALATLLWRHR
jgi:hypothetical protein